MLRASRFNGSAAASNSCRECALGCIEEERLCRAPCLPTERECRLACPEGDRDCNVACNNTSRLCIQTCGNTANACLENCGWPCSRPNPGGPNYPFPDWPRPRTAFMSQSQNGWALLNASTDDPCDPCDRDCFNSCVMNHTACVDGRLEWERVCTEACRPGDRDCGVACQTASRFWRDTCRHRENECKILCGRCHRTDFM